MFPDSFPRLFGVLDYLLDIKYKGDGSVSKDRSARDSGCALVQFSERLDNRLISADYLINQNTDLRVLYCHDDNLLNVRPIAGNAEKGSHVDERKLFVVEQNNRVFVFLFGSNELKASGYDGKGNNEI
jgi:hypothetical protein